MENRFSKYRAPDIGGAVQRKTVSPAELARHKLVLVTAGPGYGKTVFAAQLCRDAAFDHVWFRPCAVPPGPEAFLAAFISGVSAYYPGFDPDDSPGSPDSPARVMASLESVLTRDLILVVDDCHELDENPQAVSFLQAACDRYCPRLHLILSGRNLPGVKLSRLTAESRVLRFAEPELAFTTKETAALVRNSCSMDQIRLLTEKTWGWPAGLVLFTQAKKRPGQAVSMLKGSHRLVADYFKENVYDRLPREVQVFLLKTAVLNRLDSEFCARLTGTDRARQILRSLEDGHFFVFAVDEDRESFSRHPLFREFLEDRISEELGPGELARLCADAARLYERENQGKEALVYYIRAGRRADAARLLNRFARPILKEDRPGMLKSLLSVIPAHYMDDEPWFQYLQAGYYGVCRQLQPAVKAYEKVLAGFRRKADVQGECMVLMELAEHYLSAGDTKKAEQAYTRILLKDHLDAFLTIIVMGYMIRVLALEGRTGDADHYARKAMALLKELDSQADLDMGRAWIQVAQGYRYAFSGGYEKAITLGEEAKSLFKGLGESRFLLSAYFLISHACFYLGQFEKGRDAAREGIETAVKNGIEDEFSEFLILLRARNTLELPTLSGDGIETILADAKKSLSSFRAGGFPGGVAQGCLVLCRAYLRKGAVGFAEERLRAGMAAIKGHDLPLIKNELHVTLSNLLLFKKSPPQKREAFILLKDAEQDLQSSGWHISWISRIFARYYWEYGHRETAYKYMVYSLKISEEEGFDAWMHREGGWIVPILVSMAAQGSMKPYIHKLFGRMDERILATLAGLEPKATPAEKKAVSRIRGLVPRSAPLPIRVRFFDRFRLFVGERQVRPEQWRSLKALTLCKYLLANGHEGFVDRDILMELLWPDEDPKRSAQRFHVAMASIRKTLEPDIAKGTRSAYIRRSGQAYTIDIQEKGSADIRMFSDLIAAAKKETHMETCAGLCQEANAFYKGPFLREDPFEDWCVPIRKKYKQMALWAMRRVMQCHEARAEWDQCVLTATAYLEVDPLDEIMIQNLMRFHARNGNRVMASRLYARFKRRVKEELDCGVSGETTALYEHLVSRA